MTKNNGLKLAALAASIALAMTATSAFAADPAANALPGQGKVTGAATAAITGTTAAPILTVTSTGNSTINWGAGTATTDINNTGTAGFNIGSAATVTFAGNFGVLNIDSTGNASQIFGALNNTGTGTVYVANTNGIIVGAKAVLTTAGGFGLIGNTLIDSATTFNAVGTLTNYQGAGGDVTVIKNTNATASTGTILISGGGNVNVDLANLPGATTTINAGVKGGTLVGTTNNTAAAANVTTSAAATLAALGSAGTAATSGAGTLTLTQNNVTGALTNNGDMVLANNNAKGSLTNNGTLALPATGNGIVVNQGQMTSAGAGFVALTNSGTYTLSAAGNIVVGSTGATGVAGSLTNNGTISIGGVGGTITVNDGSIVNNGTISGVTDVITQSDAADGGYVAGGQYFINNAGTINAAAGGLTIDANANTHTGATNTSTGSFTNTGTLNVAAAGDALQALANNNVTLGGTLQAGGTVVKSGHVLGAIDLGADFNHNGTGVLTVSPALFGGGMTLFGNQVKLMGNVTSSGTVSISAGAAPTGDYSVRVASGKTVKGSTVNVDGNAASDLPSTILQGTISADTIAFGSGNTAGDIISGPAGGLVVSGAAPTATFNFAGRLKTAPYLNNANNFRYNYLPISLASGATAPVHLTLNPVKYQTNGTSNGLSGVNLMVNGDVELTTMGIPALASAATGVTGVTNWQNTHLVLQSAGDITMAVATYWPGYVYLGTVDSDSNGNGLAGTLSDTGTIDLNSVAFNNVLPGDVAGASGIHFMTGNALANGTTVTTNANALVNFPTDTLTQAYATGLLGTPTFNGGVASGLVVTYGTLAPEFFFTHPVDATK